VFGLLHAGVEEQVAAITLVQLGLYAVLTLTIARLITAAGQQPAATPPQPALEGRP